MTRFERSSEGRDRGPRASFSNRESRGRRSFGDGSRDRRDSGRGFDRNNRSRRDLEMTKVICSSCGEECEVPFKPTSSKPVYCRDCFAKQDKGSSFDKHSDRGLDIINEKLDKIMKSLNIK